MATKLQTFLETSHAKAANWMNFRDFHIVLGNEAGDLDSVMSTIGYAHFLHYTLGTGGNQNVAVFPVLNFDREGMDIRLEHKFLFEKAKLDLDKFIYRDQLDFDEMIRVYESIEKTIKTYLVDHHMLNDRDDVLKYTVCQIFDHRPLDRHFVIGNIKVRIEHVASCCTLIANEFIAETRYVVDPTLAYLMFCTISYDMKGFDNPGSIDQEMKLFLMAKSHLRYSPKKVYEQLYKLYSKYDHMTPLQMLNRDLKREKKILFPRLSMLVSDFMKLKDAYTAIVEQCKKYQSNLAVLIGTKRELKKDIVDMGILYGDIETEFRKEIESKLERANFVAIETEYENFVILEHFGKRIGRKKILPIVLEVCENLRRT